MWDNFKIFNVRKDMYRLNKLTAISWVLQSKTTGKMFIPRRESKFTTIHLEISCIKEVNFIPVSKIPFKYPNFPDFPDKSLPPSQLFLCHFSSFVKPSPSKHQQHV